MFVMNHKERDTNKRLICYDFVSSLAGNMAILV